MSFNAVQTLRSVCCSAVGRRRSGPRGGRQAASTRKGFAKPGTRAEEEAWEAGLPPYYRAYYRSGFKPPRFRGPIDLAKHQDGSVDVVASEELLCSQLLSVSPALVFLEGTFGTTPDVEALHAQLVSRGAGTPPAVARVLHLLPRAPADSAPDGGSGASASGSVPPVASPLAAADDILDLDPKFWSLRADKQQLPSSAPPGSLPPADALMCVLQASSYGEDYLDPATSQLRHELPVGFIGVWPDLAAMRHSCAPNTSFTVLGGGYGYIHAARDVEPAAVLTANKIGSAIVAPQAERHAALRALTGGACSCNRCALEASLPEALQQQLAELHARVQSEWAAALEAAAAAEDHSALETLWEDVTLDVDALWEALGEAGLSSEDADMLAASAYGAVELAWTLEELTQKEPRVSRLAATVRLLRAVVPGSESHLATAMQLQGLVTAQATQLLKAHARQRQRTTAAEKRLMAKVVAANQEAEGGLVAFLEAMYMRYGFIPEEGLLPQLQSALQLFYAGLEQMAAGASGGGGGADMLFDGIPVTVVDKAMKGAEPGRAAAPEFEMSSGGSNGGAQSGSVQLRAVEAEPSSGGGLVFGEEGSLHEDGPLLVGTEEALDEAGPEGILAP